MSQSRSQLGATGNHPTEEVSATDEARLTDAMKEYFAALEAGQPLDREVLLQRYPGIADELAASLDGIDFLHSVAPQLAAPEGKAADGSAADIRPSLALGDFRIIRQIGRGGMGVVYEAEQLSMGRRVALKVLPFAAVLDSKQLARFKNEAHAAGQLHHQNIVPVHSVGCERGVHYYAMQYIEGQTLAEMIRDLRRLKGLADKAPADGAASLGWVGSLLAGADAPAKVASEREDAVAASQRVSSSVASEDTGRQGQAAISTQRSTQSPAYFRSIARLSVEVARALDHAHQHGIVHRDIKPSNVILDGEGKPWITDFGLAHVETGSTLTISGDLLGTLRYMSPEQALGKRAVLDHRTDIYSLGVTIYELLALRPAFSGHDRQALMRQIAFEEPRPLQRVSRAIPRELETIVLKATAKPLADRYSTAQDLAEDLQRFLDDEPIHARRPSLVERAAKWSRRHRAAVWAAVVVLTIGLLATAAIGWNRYHLAIATAGDVEKHLAAAGALFHAGDYATAEQETTRAQALLSATNVSLGSLAADVAALAGEIAAKTEAQRQFDRFQELCRAAHADMYGGTVEPIARARKNCRTALALYGVSGAGDWRELRNFQNLGPEQRALVTEQAAELLFVSALLDVTQKRAAEGEAAAHRQAIDTLGRIEAFHRPVPAVYLWSADSHRVLGDEKRAEQAERRAAERKPTSAFDYFVLGEFQYRRDSEGDREAALGSYALALQEQPDHDLSLLAYGLTLWELGRHATAEAILTGAIAVNPRTVVAYIRRGQVRYEQEKRDLAEDDFRKAVQLDPSDYDGHWALAALLQQGGKHEKALLEYTRAIERVPLAIPQLLVRCGACRASLGDHQQAVTYLTRALDAFGDETDSFHVPYRGAISFQRQALHLYRAYHDGRKQEVYCRRAKSYHKLGKYRQAVDDLTESLRLDATDVHHLCRRGNNYSILGELDKAIKDYTETIQRAPDESYSYACRGNAYRRQGRFYLALADFDKALQLQPGLLAALFFRAPTRLELGDPEGALTDLRKVTTSASDGPVAPDQLADMAWLLATYPDPRLRDPDRAVRWATRAAKQAPNVGWVLNTLGVAQYRAGQWSSAIETLKKCARLEHRRQPITWLFLAMAYWQLGEREQACRWYDEAATWIRQNQSKDEALRRFRSEAEELLDTPGVHDE